MGGELGGKTFQEVFNSLPKIVEFSQIWEEKRTTGIFRRFAQFVKKKLSVPTLKIEHEIRLTDYLRGKTNLPDYLRQKTNLHCV